MVGRLVWTIVGALVGAFFGAGVGIAGAGVAFSGLTIFAVIGGVIGFLATPDISALARRFWRN
jgi:hypothetical protein